MQVLPAAIESAGVQALPGASANSLACGPVMTSAPRTRGAPPVLVITADAVVLAFATAARGNVVALSDRAGGDSVTTTLKTKGDALFTVPSLTVSETT